MTFDLNAIALPLQPAPPRAWSAASLVMRRMNSRRGRHLAISPLPGIGVAILLAYSPDPGGVAALLVGTLLVWGNRE